MEREEAHAILAHADRTHVVQRLIAAGGRDTIEKLAGQIAARSREARTDSDGDRPVEMVKIGLVHNHLPRLRDHGVVEYDRRNGDVVLADATDLEPLLADPPESQIPHATPQ